MTVTFFKLEYTVSGLMISPEDHLSFDYGGPHYIKVQIYAPSVQDQAIEHISFAFCTTSSKIEPNEKSDEIFIKIAANQIISQSDETTRISLEYPLPDGSRVYLPALSDFPESFRSFMTDVNNELADYANRTISTLKWRAKERGPHNPLSTRGFHWSIDGNFWHPAPQNTNIRMSMHHSLHVSGQMLNDVQNLVNARGNAPLHHDLFREAWEQRGNNLRSALILGMAAAEISVKQCIATLIPNAEWLAFNLPTPPLIQMLTDYLPILPAQCNFNGHVKSLPQEVLDVIRKCVTIRNNLAHKGTANLNYDNVENILLAVYDLLWLMDYYSGFEWACDYIRPETRSKM